MSETFILSAVHQTNRERYRPAAQLKEALRGLPSSVLGSAFQKSALQPSQIELGYWGGVNPPLDGRFPWVSVSYPWASSLQAALMASQAVGLGDIDLSAAGGCGSLLSTSTATRAGLWNAIESLIQNAGLDRCELAAYSQIYLPIQDDGYGEQAPGRNPGQPRTRTQPSEETAAYHVSIPISGAGVLVCASTNAVGRLNLTPTARIVSRTIVPFEVKEPLKSMRHVVQESLKKTGVGQGDLDSILFDHTSPALGFAWYQSMGVDPFKPDKPFIPAIYQHAGEAQGVIQLSRLIRHLVQNRGKLGLYLHWDAARTAIACLVEAV